MNTVAQRIPAVNRNGRKPGGRVGDQQTNRRSKIATAAQPPLGNHADNLSLDRRSPPATGRLTPDEQRKRKNGRRRERFALRFKIRQVSTLQRVRKCGWCSVNGTDVGGIGLRVTAKGGQSIAGFSGLATCGSPWACPRCGATIATRRAEELSDLMRYANGQGCTATMVTLTLQHHKGQSLKASWEALSKAWQSVVGTTTWKRDRERFGLIGFARAVEVTYGKNGWHPHLHVMLIWRNGAAAAADAEFVAGRMWERWARSLQRQGYDSLRDSGGLDVRVATLDPDAAGGNGLHEYFVKLAHELTGGGSKIARGHGRTPFQIITDAFDTGDADDFDRWSEWEQASQGRRSISYSNGLRDWAKLMPDLEDEEIAAEELGADEEIVIDGDSWCLLRLDTDKVCDLLEAAERAGLAGAGRLLDQWCMDWWRRTPRPPDFAEPNPVPHAVMHWEKTA